MIEENYKARMLQNRTPTAELIAQALRASEFCDSDDDALSNQYWEPVRVLHCRADDEVMQRASELLESTEADARALGANILSQVSFGDEKRGPVAADLLARALEGERDEPVLDALIYALGHTPCAAACGRLEKLAKHPSADLRYAVAYALPMHAEYRETTTGTLLALMKDADSDVRDWATFGVGSLMEVDTAEVRDALRARLADTDDDTRGEAMVGLARRGDSSLIPVIFEELRILKSSELPKWSFLAEAVEESISAVEKSRDAEWLPLLKELRGFQSERIPAGRIDEVISLVRS